MLAIAKDVCGKAAWDIQGTALKGHSSELDLCPQLPLKLCQGAIIYPV